MNDTNELIYKTETDSQNKHGYESGRRNRLGVWDSCVHTTIFKIDNQ